MRCRLRRSLFGGLPDRTAPHGAVPWDEHVGVEHGQRRQAAHAAGLVMVEQPRQQLRALPAATGCPVTSASPLTSTPSTMNEQWPPVCPGLGMAIGVPGSPAATSSVNACAVGMPSRVNAPLRLIATDHFSQRGCQTCVATSTGDACSRYSRWAWPTSAAWQYTGVPWVFANQIADPKWSMCAWVNRIARRSSTPNPRSRSEVSTSSRLPGKPASMIKSLVVGDQGPVHQVGLREVQAVGDGAQSCCHLASVGSGVETRCG